MKLIEKYKRYKFQVLLEMLGGNDIERDIFDIISYVQENGETYLEGKSLKGVLYDQKRKTHSFSITNTPDGTRYKVRKYNRTIVLEMSGDQEYFYKESIETQNHKKTLSDKKVINRTISRKDKKIYQEGIELVNEAETKKECFLQEGKNNKTPLSGENYIISQKAVRTTSNSVLIGETKKVEGKELRSAKMIEDVSVTCRDLLRLNDQTEKTIDVSLFDEYVKGNTKVLSLIHTGIEYIKSKNRRN